MMEVACSISRIAFKSFTAEEILKLSVLEVANIQTFDALGHPTVGGLCDPAFGRYLVLVSTIVSNKVSISFHFQALLNGTKFVQHVNLETSIVRAIMDTFLCLCPSSIPSIFGKHFRLNLVHLKH